MLEMQKWRIVRHEKSHIGLFYQLVKDLLYILVGFHHNDNSNPHEMNLAKLKLKCVGIF